MKEIMTYKEFKKAIEEWGNNWGIVTEVFIKGDWISVCIKNENSDLELVVDISSKDICIFDFSYQSTVDLGDVERKTLFKIVTMFANTWPADRKDKEKKYYLRHRFIKSLSEQTYLAKGEKYLWIMNRMKTDADYQQFTLEEIEDLKMLYDTDLKDFELIEVEENA